MTRYSSGSDVNYYLETWQGNFAKANRIGRECNFVSNPLLNILGGTQPNLLHRFAKGDNLYNGFFQRILFVFPDNQKKANRSKERMNPTLTKRYDDWVQRVFDLSFDKNAEEPTTTLFLTDEADKRWEKWYNQNTKEINDFEDENAPIVSCFGKLEQYCLRFSLILEVIYQSKDTFPEIKEISLASVEKAILLTEYFKSTLFKVFEKLENPLKSYSKKDLDFFNALEDDFNIEKGLETAQQVGLTTSDKDTTLRRAFFRKMTQFIKDGIIEKVDKALYTKLV
jgi:hypothetical protein